MKEKLIDELNNLLSNNESSTATILNKVIHLADVCNDKFYSLLFTYHLNGISNDFSNKLYEVNKPLSDMFSSDRMKSGETFYLIGSLASLERNLQNCKDDIKFRMKELENFKSDEPSNSTTKQFIDNAKKSGISTTIGKLRTQEMQYEEILLKIRNRAGSFVYQEEAKNFNNKTVGNLEETNIFEDVPPHPSTLLNLLHPSIIKVSKTLFESGHYSDSVLAGMREVNAVLKAKVKILTGVELDGAKLMQRTFSTDKPYLLLGDLTTATGQDLQQGYQQLFSGAIIGIRNPKAHENMVIDSDRAIHLLFLASLLMHKIDESVEP